MKKRISIIISILLSFGLIQCAGDFFDAYEKGRYVEENPPAPDTTPPLIAKAEAVAPNMIDVEFTEEVTPDSAQAFGNYHIQGLNRLEIIGAVLKPDGKTVTLEISVDSRDYRMKNGMEYTILVQNVADTAIPGNPIKYAISNFIGMGWVVAELPAGPPALTNETTATFTVGGTDIIAYQYSIDGGEWTVEHPVSEDIALTGLTEGYHTLKVIAQKSGGEWQEINYATVYGWTIDTTPPIALMTSTPDNITENTTTEIYVTGNDVTHYQYQIEYRVDQNYGWSIISTYSDEYPVSEALSLSALMPGMYRVSVIGKDPADNWQDELDAVTFEWTIIEENEIVAVLYNLPEKSSRTNYVNITVGGLRILYYKYSLDGGPWTDLTGINNPLYIEGLSESSHTLDVLGADEFSITQENPTTYTWSLDSTAPTAALSNTPASLSYDQFIHVIVSGEQVFTYRYKIDNGQWSGLINSALPIDISGFTEGSHTLYVSGVDEIGNEQKDQFATTNHSWTIDVTPPTAVLDPADLPPAKTSTTGISITVEGADVTAYKYKIDSNSWSAETNISVDISGTLSDGSHQIYVIGRDAAGNWQNIIIPTTFEWIVDTTPPTAVLSNAPNNPTPLTTIDIDVTGPGVAAYKYVLDPADPGSIDWGSISENDIADSITGTLSVDDHSIYVIARDDVNNWQTVPTSHEWTIDTSVPQAVLTVTSPALTYPPMQSTSVTSISINVSGTGITWYKYRIDWGTWSAETNVATPITESGLTEGPHIIHARGMKAGNIWQTIANATVFEWTIDLTPPTNTLSGLPNNPSIETSIDISVGGIGVWRYKYLLDPGTFPPPNMSAWSAVPERNPATQDIEASGLAEVTHRLYVIARDSAGNWPTDANMSSYMTSYVWIINTSSANCTLSNVPPDPTSSTSASIIVGPPSLESYKYRYGNPPAGAWTVKAIDQPLVIAGPLSDGLVQLEVCGKDIAGNEQSESIPTTAQWTVDTTRPTCKLIEISLPNNPTSNTSTNIFVGTETGSSPVVSYKYKIDSSTWQDGGNPEIGYPVADPIALTGLTDGYHRLYVIGRSGAGLWQLLSAQTTYTWMVDNTGPDVTLSNTPPAFTTDTSETIWVGGSGVVKYKYALENASPNWALISEVDITNPISLSGLSVTGHELRVIGRDDLENWGPVNLLSWTVTYIESPAANDSGAWDSDPLLRFSWTNPANTGGVWIQVATDAGFSNIVFDSNALGAVEYYNYIADPDNGGGYYARLKVKDLSNHWSDNWGTASNGINLSGSISGKVADTADPPNAIVGATIELRYMSDNTAVLDPEGSPVTSTTLSGGLFSIPNTYTGTNYYKAIATSADGRHATKNNITVVLGEDTYIDITMVQSSNGAGNITGTTVDANDGSIIGSATVEIVAWDGNIPVTTTSNATTGVFNTDGTFTANVNDTLTTVQSYSTGATVRLTTTGTLPAASPTNLAINTNYWVIRISDTQIKLAYTLANALSGTAIDITGTGAGTHTIRLGYGTYSITMSKSYPPRDYYDLTVDNKALEAATLSIDRQALCEVLTEPQVRVITLWGSQPTDLDMHMVGETDNAATGDTNWDGAPNNRFHIYYGSPHKSYNETTGLYVANPGDSQGVKSTSSLVQDDVNSYGPEAINIFRLGAVQYDRGIYTYSLHAYTTTTGTWGTEDITMRVYDSLGMVREINFPKGKSTDKTWKVFKLNIQGISRLKRKLYVINQFVNYDNTQANNKTNMDW